MPCRSDYLEPTSAELATVDTDITKLKQAVDELVHFCDEARDTIEAFYEGKTVKLPRIDHGSVLVNKIGEQIIAVRTDYAYSGMSSSPVRREADVSFDIAAQVVAQFDRVKAVVEQMARSVKPADADLARLRQDQIQHRMGDMMRVYKHFANKDTLGPAEIAMLSSIDLTKPLTPQLGFDPDTV